MRLVHLADLHLGYRAYHRTNAQGVNIREVDVARAFREALELTATIEPDLVIIAGDVFHTVRPSNAAIADAFRQFSQFCARTPDVPVVMIAGNHDSPKAAETGNILSLFDEIPGIHVVHQEPRRLAFPQLDAAVLCVPHSSLLGEARPAFEPDPAADVNILVAHGAHEHLPLTIYSGAALLRSDELEATDWTYVALGHYHIRSRLAPNMYYPGAIERTSMNIWAEGEGGIARQDDTWPEAPWAKGLIEFDLATGEPTFHRLESPRPVIDLKSLSGEGRGPEELNRAIAGAVESVEGGIEGKIVRLRVYDVPRDVYRELDHRGIREYRTRALHFHLDVRPPTVTRREGSAAPGRRLSVEEELVEFLERRWKPDAKRIDRDALVELGLRYMKEAEEAEATESG